MNLSESESETESETDAFRLARIAQATRNREKLAPERLKALGK
jgi:hypothetical protein